MFSTCSNHQNWSLLNKWHFPDIVCEYEFKFVQQQEHTPPSLASLGPTGCIIITLFKNGVFAKTVLIPPGLSNIQYVCWDSKSAMHWDCTLVVLSAQRRVLLQRPSYPFVSFLSTGVHLCSCGSPNLPPAPDTQETCSTCLS